MNQLATTYDRPRQYSYACQALFQVFTFLAVLLVLDTAAFAASPSAGTVIENRAMATYYNPSLDRTEMLESNPVQLVVQPVEALSLAPDLQLLRSQGEPVTFAHTLANTGNTPFTCTLTVTPTTGSDFTLTTLTLYRDLNQNGIADSGEPAIANGGTITLAPGESAGLAAIAFIPTTTIEGQSSSFTITAISNGQGASSSASDRVIVSNASLLNITKSASTTAPIQGQDVTYTISAINNGNGTATGSNAPGGQQLLIDGTAAQLILLRDPIPPNTSYVSGSLERQTDGTLLYHKTGAPAYSYVTNEPSEPIDEVAYGITELPLGRIGSFSFTVRINSKASGKLANIAYGFFNNSISTLVQEAASNSVTLDLPAQPTVISFFTDTGFGTPARATNLGSQLFLQAEATSCNNDPATSESYTIILTSALTGDEESFSIVETGQNTGVFRVSSINTQDARTVRVVKGDTILQALQHDQLTASINGCGSSSATARILIDPGGIVYDSRSNQPVAGAKVQLEVETGGTFVPATVYATDGITPMPNAVTTGADGSFDFPLVDNDNNYRVVVTPANGWSFPSKLTPLQQPAGRTIVDGSYGASFRVDTTTGPVHLDVPLDPAAASGLFVEKSASKTTAEIADVVDYTVTIKNSSGKLQKDVVLNDTLPFGFSYQKGSTRRDGTFIADPNGDHGPRLSFELGEIADGAQVQITYRLKIGPGAMKGDGINRAQATAAYGTVSNVASAVVKVEPGVFTDKGIILGKIFVDCDRDRLQGNKEPGIPGVRVYMEDGTYAITDSEGKYSFYGISPRSHVLKLDETTLPPGSELEVLSNRHAGDAASRFVDLKAGEMHRADFAEGSCNAELLTYVRLRRLKGEVFTAETKRGLDTKLALEQQSVSSAEIKSRPASGLIGPETKLPYFSPVLSGEQQQNRPSVVSEPATAAVLQDYTESMAKMDTKPGFIDLKDGDILPIAQSTVRIKGAAGSTMKLLVNGELVDDSRIGKKIIIEDQKLEAREYIGVTFKPGENRLELVQADPFGNPRGSAAISVIAPDALAKMDVQVPAEDIGADGQTPVTVRVRLTDDKGVPVTSRTPVTLEASLGRWDVRDLSEQEPGVQVFIEGGQAEFRLFAPAEPGIATVRVSSNNVKTQKSISFIPDLRPIIAVGVVEGTLNLRKMDLGAITPARSQDGFEQELRTISSGSNDKGLNAAGRAAFFLKGKIKGDYLLTMSYDSDKDTQEKLFRDISPDEFYPVYGDSSIRGFDAQSTGRFYVRVDKNRSYLLYGDFTTQASSEVRVLGAYSRSLTGVRGRYENSLLSANGFASQDKSRQIVDEIAAMGVSGPYYLSTADIVANSEKIEIITRDRNQPSLVIKSVSMSRFSDYEIESLTGRIIFKEPINSRDADLNLVYIRATYEAFQGGAEFWVAGGDAQLKLHERLEIGGSYVRDENPLDRQELGSVNGTVKLAEKTFLLAEWAHLERQTTGSGNGQRVELRHEGERLNARVYGSQTGAGFDNPSSAITKGRTEAGAKTRYTLNSKAALTTEAIFSEDMVTHGNRKGAIVNLEYSVARYLKAELGVRYAKESVQQSQTVGDATLTPTENTSIRTKLGLQLPFYSKISLFGEYEQSVESPERRTIALGGDYQFAPQSRLYARHELISSLAGQFSLNGSQQRNTTVVGVESEYMKDGNLFSEYRMRDSVSGRDSEAALGLRNGWQLTSGIRLSTNLERISTIGGSVDNDSTAVGAGLEYSGSDRWKGSSRLEYRTSSTTDSYLGTLGAALKLNRSVTLLGREIVSHTQNKDATSGVKVQSRSQIGFAYRPVDSNRWNLLSKYEFRYEGDSTNPDAVSNRVAHIISTSLNIQPSRPLVISGRYAAKIAFDESGGLTTRSSAHMVTGRVTYDLTKKWDLGLNAMSLFSGDFRSNLYGIGNEVGYLMTANLWLSAGYNYFGFYDKDLSGEDYTNPGMFMRMRFKFDEHLFDGMQKKTLNDGPQNF